MPLLSRLKAMFSSEPWIRASTSLILGRDTVRQSFSPQNAVATYRSWIYAAANLNAVAVASTPLRLYIRKRGGKQVVNSRKTSHRMKAYLAGDTAQSPSVYAMRKAAEYGDDYEVVNDSHPLLDLLTKVNPFQNGYDATVLRILYTELTGNAYLHPVIGKQMKVPVQLWTMPSQWVEIVPSVDEFIGGYLYGQNRETKKIFASDEVIHFKRPNPADLYYGIGKVEAAWGAVQMNRAAQEMDLSFFENKARPDYIMSLRANASAEELERLEVQIEDKLRGSRRSGRFLTTTADLQLTPLSFPPKDLAGRDDVVEEIAAVFGVPVSMLKANDPNLASASTGYSMWRETTILPMLRMDEEVLNQKLLPLFGIEDDAFVCYDNPVIADKRFELEERRTAVSGGWRTVNEARVEEGREPFDNPNADLLLYGNAPLGAPASMPPPTPVGASASTDVVQQGKPAEALPEAEAAVQPSVDDPAVPAPAAAALNGAQISSLISLASQSRSGELPILSARAIATAAFPFVSPALIESIFAPIVVQPPKPTPEPEPQPTPEAVVKNCGTGSDGFQSGNTCAAGGGSGGSGSSVAKPSSHNVKLPRDPRRITIDQFDQAVRAMGYTKISERVENPNSREDRKQYYTLSDKDGNKQEMEESAVLSLVYSNSDDPTTAAIKPPSKRRRQGAGKPPSTRGKGFDALSMRALWHEATYAVNEDELYPALFMHAQKKSEPYAIEKNCGTGSDGFEAGNTCAAGDGSGEGGKAGKAGKEGGKAKTPKSDTAKRTAKFVKAFVEKIEVGLKALKLTPAQTKEVVAFVQSDNFQRAISLDPASIVAVNGKTISATNSVANKIDEVIQSAQMLDRKIQLANQQASNQFEVVKAITNAITTQMVEDGRKSVKIETGKPLKDLSIALQVQGADAIIRAMFEKPFSKANISCDTGSTKDLTARNAGGIITYDSNTIGLRADSDKYGTAGALGIIVHEMTHGNHGEKGWMGRTNPFPPKSLTAEQKTLALSSRIDAYGTTNDRELVARFNEHLAIGGGFTEAMWSMYDSFKGPRHRADFRASRTLPATKAAA